MYTELVNIFKNLCFEIKAKQISVIRDVLNPLPDLLRADSSAGHCWSSIVANFSCPSCAVAGSSAKSTRSSEDIALTAEGHCKSPLTNTGAMSQIHIKQTLNTELQLSDPKTCKTRRTPRLAKLGKNKSTCWSTRDTINKLMMWTIITKVALASWK